MIVALYILLAMVAVGLPLWLLEQSHRRKVTAGTQTEVVDAPADEPEQCCGMHITCERDSLLAAVSPTIEYFDDEELDACRGISPVDYTDAQIEQFRDVLLTLLPDDIAPWARSLQLRGIELPEPVRDELLMMVAEARSLRIAAQKV